MTPEELLYTPSSVRLRLNGSANAPVQTASKATTATAHPVRNQPDVAPHYRRKETPPMTMTTFDPDQQRGLYDKYRVDLTSGGEVGPCFVLAYVKDPHARVALAAYAQSCADDFPALAADLRRALAAVLTAKDFEMRYDDTHTYPFYETENADWLIGYGHGDKAEFANAINEYDRYVAELDPDDANYTENDVRHLWAVVFDTDTQRISWRGVTAETPGAFPISVVSR